MCQPLKCNEFFLFIYKLIILFIYFALFYCIKHTSSNFTSLRLHLNILPAIIKTWSTGADVAWYLLLMLVTMVVDRAGESINAKTFVFLFGGAEGYFAVDDFGWERGLHLSASPWCCVFLHSCTLGLGWQPSENHPIYSNLASRFSSKDLVCTCVCVCLC